MTSRPNQPCQVGGAALWEERSGDGRNLLEDHMDDDATDLDLVRDLVKRANANTISDAADLGECIRGHDLVFGASGRMTNRRWGESAIRLSRAVADLNGSDAPERPKCFQLPPSAVGAPKKPRPCGRYLETSPRKSCRSESPKQSAPPTVFDLWKLGPTLAAGFFFASVMIGLPF